jgi:hypothetical protein
VNGFSSEVERIDAGLFKILHSFAAEKLAADFVMSGAFALKQGDFSPGGGQSDGDPRAGKTASDDQMRDGSRCSAHWGFLRATHNLAGLKA